MARSSRFWPLSIIAIGLVFMFWVSLSTTPNASWAQPSCDERPAYPGCVEVPVNCGSYPASVCDVTKTAVIATRTAVAAPVLTQTAQAGGQQSPQASATPTATTGATASATPSLTPTATPTLAGPLASPTPTATRPTVNTVTPALAASPTTITSPSPTPAITATLRCAPGDLLELTGEARPQTALLVLFDDRPVGGGASDRSGAFRIVLRIGEERPGLHEIIVRERERAVVVAEYICETPPPPTPTPTFGPIRATVTTP